MSAQDYLDRGIGLRLRADLEGLWVVVALDVAFATVRLPNFAECGIARAREQTQPIFETLTALGFVALDFESGEPCADSFDESFERGYIRREAQISLVASLTKGRVP